MNEMRFPRGFGLLLLLALAINIGYFAFSINPAEVSLDESGAVETFQLVYLGGAALLFFVAGMMQSGATRMFCVGMAILCVVFFLRELEIADIGPVTSYMNSKLFRVHEAIVVITVALIYLGFRWRFVSEMARFVFSTAAWPFYVAAIFLLIGAYCNSQHGSVAMQIKEEISESASYLSLLVIAAGLCYQYIRSLVRSRDI